MLHRGIPLAPPAPPKSPRPPPPPSRGRKNARTHAYLRRCAGICAATPLASVELTRRRLLVPTGRPDAQRIGGCPALRKTSTVRPVRRRVARAYGGMGQGVSTLCCVFASSPRPSIAFPSSASVHSCFVLSPKFPPLDFLRCLFVLVVLK